MEKEIKKQLECPICFELCSPPIYQCQQGHNVCSTCREQIKQCAICRGPIEHTRNFFAEEISKKVKHNKHLAECHHTKPTLVSKNRCYVVMEYSNYFHPSHQCSWRGDKLDLLHHVEKDHEGYAVRANECDVSFTINRSVDYGHVYPKLFFTEGNLFWCCIYNFPSKNLWYVYARLMGTKQKALRYTCEFTLFSKATKQRIMYSHTPLSREQDFLNEKMSHVLCLSENMMANFIINNNLNCKVQIKKH